MSNSIPKTIHYCWFGKNPLPKLAVKCIESWKKYLPDYNIIQWDESNFDISSNKYAQQAYEAKKYAFVSDYARFKILYEQGGIYFDTDVEVIRNMDNIISAGPFMGCENASRPGESPFRLLVAAGLGLGAVPGMPLYREILDLYENNEFINQDGSFNQKTVVYNVTEILCRYGLKNIPDIQEVAGVKIYPVSYFCPLDYKTKKLDIKTETVSIHWYDASWISKRHKFILSVQRIVGKRTIRAAVIIKSKLKNILRHLKGVSKNS